MKQFLSDLFSPKPTPSRLPNPPQTKNSGLLDPATSAYLPVEPTVLLQLYSSQISAVRQIFPSYEEYSGVPANVIADLACYLHLLPASISHHHSDPGGAFRHALEVGYYAVRSAKPLTVTPHIGGKRRYDEETQKCTVAFLLGALHDIGKPFNDYVVRSADNPSTVWAPNQMSLYEWATKFAPSGYHVERATNYNYTHHVLNRPVDGTHISSRHLSSLRPEAYSMYREALRNAEHPLWKAVESSDRISAVRDTSLTSNRHSFLFDVTCAALQHLISNNPQWVPNKNASAVHLSSSIIYISFPDGLNQLHRQVMMMDARTPRPANEYIGVLNTLGSAYTSPRNLFTHTFFVAADNGSKESAFVCLASHLAPELYERYGATELLSDHPTPSAAIATPTTVAVVSTSTAETGQSKLDFATKTPQTPNTQPDVTPLSQTTENVISTGKIPTKARHRGGIAGKKNDTFPLALIGKDYANGKLRLGPIGPALIDIVDGSIRMSLLDAVNYFCSLPDTKCDDPFLRAYLVPHEQDGYVWPDETVRLSVDATTTVLGYAKLG